MMSSAFFAHDEKIFFSIFFQFFSILGLSNDPMSYAPIFTLKNGPGVAKNQTCEKLTNYEHKLF